jgi:hypothetical protein
MIWAAATISTGFVNGLAALFVARFALGFGEGATFRRQRSRCNTRRPRTAEVLRRD